MDKRDSKKPLNEIRIGFRSRVRNIIKYCNILLKENNFRILNLSAIGGAIGSLVNAVEVLKLTNSGLYQVNKIGTISYQTVDQRGEVQNQKLYPKLEVTLTFDQPKEEEGYQNKLEDDERNALLKVFNERTEARKAENFEQERDNTRGGFRFTRGRGFRGGRFRGGRGRGGPRFEGRNDRPQYERRERTSQYERRERTDQYERRERTDQYERRGRGGSRFEGRGGSRFEGRGGSRFEGRGGRTTRRFNRGRGY